MAAGARLGDRRGPWVDPALDDPSASGGHGHRRVGWYAGAPSRGGGAVAPVACAPGRGARRAPGGRRPPRARGLRRGRVRGPGKGAGRRACRPLGRAIAAGPGGVQRVARAARRGSRLRGPRVACARDGRGAFTRIDGEMRGVVVDLACHRRPRAHEVECACGAGDGGRCARSTLAALVERHAALIFFPMNVPVSVGFRRRNSYHVDRGHETPVRSAGFTPPCRVSRASEECSQSQPRHQEAARSFGNGPPCRYTAQVAPRGACRCRPYRRRTTCRGRGR